MEELESFKLSLFTLRYLYDLDRDTIKNIFIINGSKLDDSIYDESRIHLSVKIFGNLFEQYTNK